MTERLRIATRQSALALWQAEHVAARLRSAHPGLDVALVPMKTEGDRILDRSLAAIGGKGLFIKELEVAMQEGRADLAVHSMKDVPAVMPPGMIIAAILERADPGDAFVSHRYPDFDALPEGAVVGTSSLRRQSQLRHARPDLDVRPVRGNVETRLRKLDEGDFDAVILAVAGLQRLGLGDRITATLGPARCLPAVGQGAVGIEVSETDGRTRELVAAIDHETTRVAVTAERSFARHLEASCESPIAAWARLEGDALQVEALAAAEDGSRLLRESASGPPGDAEALGRSLAETLLSRGAAELLGHG